MVENDQTRNLSKNQAAVLNYLRDGCAVIAAKSQKTIVLNGKNRTPLETNSLDLAEIAKRGWIKREGKTISILDAAPKSGVAALASERRKTEVHELFEGGAVRQVTKLVVESPIDYLASHKDKNGTAFLNKRHWSAGDRLRSDFTRANMLPGIGMRWGEPIRTIGGAGGGVTQTDAAMAAKLRVNKALAAVGPEFSGLLIDVCCYLKGLSQVEAERGWPQRSAKLMVRAGLSILERHYAPPAQPTAKIRAWGTDDYRPTL